MLATSSDIKGEVLVRLNAGTTTAGLYTDAILDDWLDMSHRWASGYRKWPFTEGRITTTLALNTDDSQTYPEGWKSDSVRILTIGGNRYQKVNFEHFLRYREDSSAGEDRIFSDFGRSLYVNPNGSSGTMIVYGQYVPGAFDRTDTSATTVFSNADETGNHAIVEEILSNAKMREKKTVEAQNHHLKAIQLLEQLAQDIKDEQYGYHSKDAAMFERFDVLEGAATDELIKRDRWY